MEKLDIIFVLKCGFSLCPTFWLTKTSYDTGCDVLLELIKKLITCGSRTGLVQAYILNSGEKNQEQMFGAAAATGGALALSD